MSDSHTPSNARAAWDALLVDIVDYVRGTRIDSPLAFQTSTAHTPVPISRATKATTTRTRPRVRFFMATLPSVVSASL